MKYGTNLIFGEAFCIFIFFLFSHSGLSVLNGLNFFIPDDVTVKTENSRSLTRMSLNGTKMRNKYGKWENEIWEQNRELEMKLLIELGFKLGYVTIFHLPVPYSPFPVPRSSFFVPPSPSPFSNILFVSSRRRVV